MAKSSFLNILINKDHIEKNGPSPIVTPHVIILRKRKKEEEDDIIIRKEIHYYRLPKKKTFQNFRLCYRDNGLLPPP